MKAFSILLLALFAGFAGYQYVYPKLDDWAQFKKLAETPVTPQPEQPKLIAKFEIPVTTLVAEPPPITPKMEESKPEQASVAIAEPQKKAPNPDQFQPPVFPPIEEVVKDWKSIPQKAFPREVTLLKEVEFVATVSGGKVTTKIVPGGKVHALEQDGDNVVIALTPTSPSRVEVKLTDTNLKELLTDAYERWKPSMVEYLRRQWDFKKTVKNNPVTASSPKLAGRNDRPERNADGSYPLLLASMKSGEVTEITPANIKKWGSLNMERIDGNEYYTVIVDYTTKTMFGDFATSAQARIRNGKVVKWIYTGSGEVVP